MISNKDIFNVNKVVMPFNSKDIDSIISKSVITGYIATTYDMLVDKLKEIAKATQYPVTLNPNAIYLGSNNPLTKNNVLIQVEGTQLYTEFINTIVKTGENESWSNFMTYSELLKDEIKSLKITAYKKFLWNYHNIDAWFTAKNIGLITNDKNILLTDFDSFKTRVLMTDDFAGFVDCCVDEDVRNAINFIVKHGCELLRKYKVELNNHIANDNKRQETIMLKNPIITKIYLQSTVANQCKKDWPKIKFNTLDKKSFDTIGLWDV